MKKKFTFLIAVLMLLTTFAIPMGMWGQTRTETTTTYVFTSKSWGAKIGETVANWTCGRAGNELTSGQGIQVTTGVTGANGTSPISFTGITQIVVRYCTNASKGAGTIKVQVGSGTEQSFAVTKPSSGGTSLKNATFTYNTAETGNVKVTVDCTTNSVYIYSVAITTTSGGGSTYTVTYNANGATSGSVPTDANSPYANGATVTVLGNTGSLAKTGHTFNNWNTLANGSGNPYSAGNTFTISSNTTLFAQWTVNTHTITLSGTTTHGTVGGFTNPVAYGTEVTLTYTTLEEYYATYTSSDVTITDGVFTMPDTDVTITVTENELPKYTITYSDGGSETEASYGAGVTLATRPGNATYTFAGWSATNIPSETTTVPTIIPTNVTYHPTSDITLYPVYTRTEGSGFKWVKTVLSDVTEGTYALITTDGHAFNGTISKGHGQTTTNAFSFTNNETTTAPDGVCELTLTILNNTQFKMYNSSNGYLYASAASSGNLAWHNSETSYWELSSSNWVYNANSAYLRSYDNSSFRTYSSSSNGDVLLMAKKVSNTTTYYVSVLSSVSVPSFDPIGQNFSTATLSVTISVSDGCFICYTTDNTDPESSSTAILTDSNSETVTVTGTTTIRALAFDGYNYSSEVSQTYTRVYEVTLSSNGVAGDPIEVTSGQTTTLTAPSNIPVGYNFRGWTATPESPSTLVSTPYGPTSNITLYAVFGQNTYGDFKKVTSDPSDWSGYYLIVYETNNIALDGSLSDLNINKNTIGVTITTVQGVQTISSNATTNASKFTFSAITGGYSIRSASGNYIGRTANSNGFNQHATNAYLNTIAYSSGVTITSSASPKLLCWAQGGNDPTWKIAYYTSNQNAIQLYKQEVISTDGYYTRVYPSNTTATGDINVGTTGPIVIESGSILDMSTYNLTCTDPTKLVIEDGGQLVCSNSVAATVKKTIVNANSKAPKDHWYTISSSVHTGSNDYVTIGAETTVNLTASSYDMFAYDESSHTWLNQKNNGGAAGFDKMNAGQGYMYRNSGNKLSFVGNTNVGAVDMPLSYTSDLDIATLKGFNLIGNPYTHSIAKGSDKAIDNASLSTGCYVLSNSGTWTLITDGNEIKPNQGVLVETSTAVANFQIKDITYVAPSKYNNDNLKFVVENAEYSDAAYAWFDKGIGLTKINHRNDRAPMLYIPQDGHNYAIAIMSDDTKVFGLNFKAATMGQYTLSYKATGEYNYIHVIDRLTGEDVDMLLDDKYTFVATPNDQENRFIVKLGYMPDYSEGNNDIFAYQTGSEILVSGTGELQIFDVTGRQVMTTTINGAESISVPAQGVYIFRLVGNEIKTQKIVVR